jgi:hypothetical protein
MVAMTDNAFLNTVEARVFKYLKSQSKEIAKHAAKGNTHANRILVCKEAYDRASADSKGLALLDLDDAVAMYCMSLVVGD